MPKFPKSTQSHGKCSGSAPILDRWTLASREKKPFSSEVPRHICSEATRQSLFCSNDSNAATGTSQLTFRVQGTASSTETRCPETKQAPGRAPALKSDHV